MARFKLVDGKRKKMSAQEEAERDAEEAEAPARAEEEKSARASGEADAAIAKELLRLLWDQERRLRALSSESAIEAVRAAGDRAAYRRAFVKRIRDLM